MEKPIHDSLDDLFSKAKLSDEEKEVFLAIRKHCEYWLLRSKVWYSEPFDSKIPNFIQRLARVLIRFFSEDVDGQKMILIKEMFPKNSFIHRIYTTKSGLRSTQNSKKIENTYFELEIMSFFLDKGYKIELASSKVKNRKIPEFIAISNDLRINVEAKQLNIDKVLDNIFGDSFIHGIDKRLSDDERDKGYKKIQERIEDNYEKAISKYFYIDNEDFFLIFISTNYNLDFTGKYSKEYLTNLPKNWLAKKYENLLGLVIVEPERTNFISNSQIDQNILKRLDEIEISEYHEYIP